MPSPISGFEYTVMAQEDTLKQLWRVVRHSFPAVATDSAAIDHVAIEQLLQRADLWLSSKTVEGYDPADFADWPADQQKVLAAAVEGFRTVAKTVAPNRPASVEQRTAAAEWLGRILQVVRPIVRDEWLRAVETLVIEAEDWCRRRDWLNHLSHKTITEPLIGQYEAAQLLVHLPEGRFMLTPISRFVAGGTGLIDLYAMPALAGRSIVRRSGKWEIIPEKSRDRPQPWSETAFSNLIASLAQEAA